MQIRMSALRACISLLLSLEEQQRSALQDCVPLLFDVLGSAFAQTDDETMVACVERLGELAAVSPKFLKAHVQPILAAMVHVVSARTLESETRRAAMTFLLTLVEEGKSMVRKGADFARQVIPLAFNFLQELEHHTEEWNRAIEGSKLEDEDEGQENYRFGCECITRLSDSLGGKVFLSVIEPLIGAAIQPTQEWNVRHAGLVAIGHMAYGVAQHMYKQVGVILHKFVLPSALSDPHPRVRWAAIEVCALLSDAFEPDFANDFHKEVFTVLMASIDSQQHWRVVAHACLCFPDFCRGLDRVNLTEYLPQFLTKMVACLGMTAHTQVVENALAAVSSVAMVSSDDFAAYYPHFMPGVKAIVTSASGEKQAGVRGKAIECIGMMAQAVGKTVFREELGPIMEALLQMLQGLPNDDPQYEHVVTSMARIGKAFGSDFAPYLPRVIPPLIRSAAIEDACVILGEGDVNPYADRAGYQTVTVEVRQSGKQVISTNTSLKEEKSRAIRMLFEYANATGTAFFPYVQEVANVIVPCVRYQFESSVRMHAVMSLAPLLRCSNAALASDPPRRLEAARHLLTLMWPVVMQGIQVEFDMESLHELLGEWADVIAELPAGLLLTGAQMEEVNLLLRTVIIDCLDRCKQRSELAESEEGIDDAEKERIDAENEQEDELLGYVYSVADKLVKNNPVDYVESFHRDLLPVLHAMMKSEDCSLRTTGLCIIAQVMEDVPNNPHANAYAEDVHAVCIGSLATDDVPLLQSVAFGFGVCSMVQKTRYAPKAEQVMRHLVEVLQREHARKNRIAQARARAEKQGKEYDDSKDGEDTGLFTDNALSALIKIFVFTFNSGAASPASPVSPNGTSSCPPFVSAVMSNWVSLLPAQSDLVEARKIHAMFVDQVQANNPYILGVDGSNLPAVLAAFGAIIGHEEWEDICLPETKQRIIDLFGAMQKSMPEAQVRQLLAAIPNPQSKEALREYVINPALLA